MVVVVVVMVVALAVAVAARARAVGEFRTLSYLLSKQFSHLPRGLSGFVKQVNWLFETCCEIEKSEKAKSPLVFERYTAYAATAYAATAYAAAATAYATSATAASTATATAAAVASTEALTAT